MRRAFIFALGGLALTGCGASLPDVPTLGPRPAEHQPILPPDPASEPASPADPALVRQLATVVAEARAGHAKFEEQRRSTAGALAAGKGASEGSEAWIAGQTALSGLDAAKGPVRDAAGTIDALRIDPAHAGTGDRAAIEAAAAEIAAMADEEARPIAGAAG